jgi:hypothetical protein
MSKSKLFRQKLETMQKQYEEALLEEQKRVGALVISLYEKGQIKDDELKLQIAKIIGDEIKPSKITESNLSDGQSKTNVSHADNHTQGVN